MSIDTQIELIRKATDADLTTEQGRAAFAYAARTLPELIKADDKAASKNKKRYTVISLPSPLFWALALVYGASITLQAAGNIARYMGAETAATEKCREVAKGTFGWETGGGILCVRPVHFIEGQP